MTTAIPSRKLSFPNLDGLRFFCFLGVFLYHSFYTPLAELRQTGGWQLARRLVANGNLGVNCFFVLSGFLITYLLLEEKSRTGKVHVGHFYLRRVLRIWPLYYACVLFGFFVFPLLKQAAGLVPSETAVLPAYLAFLGNFDLLRNGLPDASSLGVLWSISVEEQFYLLWPVLIALTAEPRLHWLLGGIVASSIVFRTANLSNPAILDLHTLAVISDMSIGGLVALLAKTSPGFVGRIERLPAAAVALVYALLGIMLLFQGTLLPEGTLLQALARVLSGCIFATIILEQNYARQSLFKFASSPGLSRLGQYTYGMYCLHTIAILVVLQVMSRLRLDTALWHVLFLHPLLGLGLTIAMSILSYRYFEEPFLRLKKRFQFVSRD